MSKVSSQKSTPGVQQWLQAQRAAGFDSLALYIALRDSGWAHEVACGLVGLQPDEVARANGIESAVPWPLGAGERAVLDGGDRPVQALAVMRSPNIVVLGNLLSPQE